MRLLVTGGAGFIGSTFVRRVLQGDEPGLRDAEVVVLDKLTYAGNEANLAPIADDPRYRFVKGDVCDGRLVRDVLAGVDAVVHFAAESHVDRSITGADPFVVTNVVGTSVLLQAALESGVDRFVHISTDEVYGSIDVGSWSETHPLEPNSPYSASKASSDLLARAYARTHGLDVRITRCSNNYGPYQFPEKLIPSFIHNAMHDRPVPLYGDGLNVRDWLHVEDHCRAVALVLDKGYAGEVYNIGGGNESMNLEITKLILKELGKGEDLISYVTDRPGHDRRYAINSSYLQRTLGWRPVHTFETGIRQTIEWYTNNTEWAFKVTAGMAD